MHSDKDIEILLNVRKYLIEISSKVFRDYKFFFQAENKQQRREIYNHVVNIDDDSDSYPIVCKSCCEMVKNGLCSIYGYDIEVITCDNDEFGHCDILVHGDKDYIINCLSDLELNQIGMKSRRFASYEYCCERYLELCNSDKLGFLSSDEVLMIDKKIGFFNGMYFDEVINHLAYEFKDFRRYLIDDEGLRESLLGDVDSYFVERMSDLDLLKIKFKFLCNYFNGRENIIGHIELVRVYKMLLNSFFSDEERKSINWNNCFFDIEKCDVDLPVFNTNQNRVRFISFQIDDMVYLISVVSNEFVYMNLREWEDFKFRNGVVVTSISGSNESISEYLRNKGIGVNIMKHSVVRKMLSDIEDCIFLDMTDSEKKQVLNDVYNQDNNVVLYDKSGNFYNIFLDNHFIKIYINDDSYIYYYVDDNLIMSCYDDSVIYKWRDEGVYEQCIVRKDKVKKYSAC